MKKPCRPKILYPKYVVFDIFQDQIASYFRKTLLCSFGEINVVIKIFNVTPETTITGNASKRIEKCLLDLRNIFLNQENIRKFFS